MPLLRRLVTRSVRRPWLALAAAAIVVVGLAWPAGSVPTDNSLAVWFVRGDPALASYRSFMETFGNDEAVVVAYRAGGTGTLGLDSAALSLQERTTAALESVDGVELVLSAAPLVRAAGQDAARPALERLGLAGEGNAVALIARLEASADMDARRGGILDAIDGVLDTTLVAAGHDVHLAGNGVLYEGLNRQTERDGAVFLGLAVLIMAVLLWLILGSVVAAGITLAPPLAATVATVGIVGWTGGSLNVVMATLPALVLVIGIADGVHVFMAWYRARRERPPGTVEERRALATDVVSRMAVPCLFTSVTTALAFLALTSSRMAVVRELGVYAAVGVTLVWALVVVGMAAGLSLVDVRPPRRAPGARLAAPLARLGPWLQRHRWRVVAAFLLATMLLGAGAARVRVDTHTLGLLPDDHRVVMDSDWIETHMGPYTPLEFVIEARAGADPGRAGNREERGGVGQAGAASVLDLAILTRVAAWQDTVEALPGVGRTLGATDLFAMIGDRVPASREAAEEQVVALASITGDDLSGYLTADRTAARVTAFVPMGTARDFAAAVDAARAAGERILDEEATVTATGYLPLYVRIIDYTVSSALTGLALAFTGVFLVLALLLRSWRMVVAAIPPNAFAVVTVFGAMGWLGIPLDIATATVGAIILGIAVDDTVHYLHRYGTALRGGEAGEPDYGVGSEVSGAAGAAELADGSPAVAATVALATAGPAMVLTAVVLILGLGVLLAAGSVSVVYFGLLITAAVAAALVADLVLLPVLVPLLARRS